MTLLLSPLWLPLVGLLWALVRIGGGPGLLAQPRLGRHGKVFRCLKLRTMVVDAEAALDLLRRDPEVDAEWQRHQKLARDPRITRLGRVLRATSLDELPQLVNVLRGEMSLVGPRPILLSQIELYRRTGNAGAYLSLRPGITGPWQIAGRHRTEFRERALFDRHYRQAMTAGLDTRLLLRTVLAVASLSGR